MKTYKLENLGCANCSAKMERKIRKLKGVKEANVNFMMQRLDLEVAEGTDEEALLQEVEKIMKKIEPESGIRKS